MRKHLLTLTVITTAIGMLIACEQKLKLKKDKELKSSVLLSKYARPLRDLKFDPTPARLKRGDYLCNAVLRCFYCHATLDSSKPGRPPVASTLGGGSILFENDSMFFGPPNISSDPETGAGKWTDDMFVRAIRQGIGHDGRALQGMPWRTFQYLSDEDLASVIVYIRSLPPVKHLVPSRTISTAMELRLQAEHHPMEDRSVAEPDSSFLGRGRYLVTIGECEGCHTAWYKRNPGFFGGGNLIGPDSDLVASANISSDLTGIGGWNDETFIRVIRTGKAETLRYFMPWACYKNMTDYDLKAILAALKTTEPVQHRIVNGIKPTHCPVCDQMHGYGDQNKIEPLKAIKVDPSVLLHYEGTYVDKDSDTIEVSFKKQKLSMKIGTGMQELLAVDKYKFRAEGMPSSISFVKDGTGKVIALKDFDLVPYTYQKVK